MFSSVIPVVLDRLMQEKIDLSWYAGKRILVTGGAGFIGSWLVEALVRLGSKTYVADNLWRGSLENLIGPDNASWIPLDEQFILGDLRKYHIASSSIRKAKPELVFHLADIVAGIDFVFANEPFLFRSNLLINSNTFTAAKEAGVEKLVYLGTACSYPRELQSKPGGNPLVEEQVYPADPESAYGWSKLMGEYELDILAKNSVMEVGVLRLHNVYGPRSILSIKGSQVIPSLIRKAVRYPKEEFIVWGSGRQGRDFVYVADVIDALLRLPLRGMGKGPIQIATAQETTVMELASLIVEISGKDIPIKFDQSKLEGDAGRSGSYEKARQILGWQVVTSLRDGIRATYEWASEQIRYNTVDLDA